MAKYKTKYSRTKRRANNGSNLLIYSMLTVFAGTVLGLIVYNTIKRSHYQEYQDYQYYPYQPYYGFMTSNQSQGQEQNHFSLLEKKLTELEQKLDKLITPKSISMKSLNIQPNSNSSSIMNLSPAETHDMKRKSFGMR